MAVAVAVVLSTLLVSVLSAAVDVAVTVTTSSSSHVSSSSPASPLGAADAVADVEAVSAGGNEDPAEVVVDSSSSPARFPLVSISVGAGGGGEAVLLESEATALAAAQLSIVTKTVEAGGAAAVEVSVMVTVAVAVAVVVVVATALQLVSPGLLSLFPLLLPAPLPGWTPPAAVVVAGRWTVTVRVPVEVIVSVVVVSCSPVPVPAVAPALAVMVVPVMIPLEASPSTLDDTDGTAVTGQTTVVKTTVSVTTTVLRASLGMVARSSDLVGQLVTVAAHEVMVRTEVVETVRVVLPLSLSLPLLPLLEVVATGSLAAVEEALSVAVAVAVTVALGPADADGESVLPVMMPLEASSRTLDETEGTAVTGQVTVVRTTVSVTITVLRASVGKLEKSSVLVGQSMTSGRHEVIVRTEVVDTVRVVIPLTEPVPLVGKGGAKVVTSPAAPLDEDSLVGSARVAVSVLEPEMAAGSSTGGSIMPAVPLLARRRR